MNREQIKGYVGMTGITLGHVEKDYLQNIILSSISRRESGDLVFKGGTALQKMGYIKRFSEDLDFTARVEMTLPDLMLSCEEDLGRYGFPSDHDRMVTQKNSSSGRLMIHGPLFEKGGVACSIYLDISYREEVLLPAKATEFAPVYPDIQPYILPTMDPKEILAEKVRAIMTRDRPRDLYDASFLIERSIELDRDLIVKKMEYYGISFESEKFIRRCGSFSESWERELSPLLMFLPNFEDRFNIIKEAFIR